MTLVEKTKLVRVVSDDVGKGKEDELCQSGRCSGW